VILLATTATDANTADDFVVSFEGDAPGEDHDLAIVGGVNAKKLTTRLAMFGQIFGRYIKGAAVYAFLIEMSMLPSQAPSMRT
jgi:hypothetical protein